MLARRLATGVMALGVASLIYSGGPPPVWALAGAGRLGLAGDHPCAARLYAVPRRALERFVKSYPTEARVGEATLLLGKSQFGLREFQAALDNFRKAQRLTPLPGRPEEARFWEAETLFRLKRYAEARAVYDALLASNAAAPVAPDAMYGLAWADLELKRPEAAAGSFHQFLAAWPDSPQAPSATFYLARTLVELKKPADAIALLAPFARRYPNHALAPDAQYLLGWSRLAAGESSEGLQDPRGFVAAHPRHELPVAARRAIAGALLKGGKKSELVQEYQSLIAQSPATAAGLYDAGLVPQQLGRQKDAEAAWRRLRTEFPKHALAPRASLELAPAAVNRGP